MHGNRKHGGNVITMSGYQQETRFRALSQVEAYWEGLRQGRDVPMRSDIDPRGIEDALEYAFILERIAPGLARLRVAGSHLSDVMGDGGARHADNFVCATQRARGVFRDA